MRSWAGAAGRLGACSWSRSTGSASPIQSWTVGLEGGWGQHFFLAEGRCEGSISGRFLGANYPRREGAEGPFRPDFRAVIETDDGSDTVNYMVNDPFKALSHPIRRGIVERLAAGPASVGDATAGFGVSKPAISKHLKVLEETGVLRREVIGRSHRLSLEPDVLSEAADWMDRQRALWGRLFDVVDDYLKEEHPR